MLWKDATCRVVLVADADYPGFCRVILGDHVREMTDLAPAARERLMEAVFATEATLRELMQPDKINLATFGNVVPHIHWHVIPRFADDRHFPASVWAAPVRAATCRQAPAAATLSAALDARLGRSAA